MDAALSQVDPADGPNGSAPADLRLRLHASQEQLRAARAEASRLARELGVTRRLLEFAYGDQKTASRIARQDPTAAVAAGGVSRVRAVPLTHGAIFGLDACGLDAASGQVSVVGWAFVPRPEWNGLLAAVSVLFRHDTVTYVAAAGGVARADVAAHFAGQSVAAGGAQGLTGVGFACEVAADSLPGGVDLEVVLRLECAGFPCEQPTGRVVRLPAD